MKSAPLGERRAIRSDTKQSYITKTALPVGLDGLQFPSYRGPLQMFRRNSPVTPIYSARRPDYRPGHNPKDHSDPNEDADCRSGHERVDCDIYSENDSDCYSHE